MYLRAAIAAESAAPVSVHEWSQSVSVATMLWVVIAALGGAVLWYALGERSEVKDTLKRLVSVIEDLRLDLAENYAKKVELERLDRKVEKLREHLAVRHEVERRTVADAESD